MNNISGDTFKTFGEMLRYLRIREQMTQRELALAVGYTDSQITRLEKNQRAPDLDVVIARFIEALHLTNQPEMAARLIELARQAGGESLPVPALATSELVRKHNLLAPTTSLIGREDDAQAVQQMMKRADVRLVTLIGPPGVGKTRLALQVGWNTLNDFADGVWFVPLASVDEQRYVARTLVQALDVDVPNLPPEAALQGYLLNKHLLLILDNFEQLLGNDDHSEAATLVSVLLAHAPALKIIVTSRAALHVQGEHLYGVPQLAGSNAVDLFIERAKANKSTFTLKGEDVNIVAEICKRLDHLPLAIELAAARVRMFEPAQLLSRLSSRFDLLTDGARDLPPRQRTLRNTIEWSYNLLSDEEQRLFRRLSIFAGGCTLEAVDQVAGNGLQAPVLNLLQSLVDKSLIQLDQEGDETRITLLETLREYAQVQLAKGAEIDDLARRHAEYYVGLAEIFAVTDNHVPPLELIRQHNREEGNWRLALDYARRADDGLLLRMLAAAMPDKSLIAPAAEKWDWIPAFLDRWYDAAPSLTLAKALRNASDLINATSESTSLYRIWLEKSMAIAHELGAMTEEVASLVKLINLNQIEGEYALGRQHSLRGLELAAQLGDDILLADMRQWWATILRDQGDFTTAAALFQLSLVQYRKLGAFNSQGLTLNGLGDLEFDRGDFPAAQTYYEQALDVWQKRGGLYVNFAYRGLGRIAYVQGDLALADALLSSCVKELRSWQARPALNCVLHHLSMVKVMKGDLLGGLSLLREAITSQYKKPMRLFLAESLERFAWIAAGNEEPKRATQLFSAAHALRQWMGVVFPLGDKPLYDRYLAMARAGLNEDDFNQAWAVGERMSLDAAVTFALEA